MEPALGVALWWLLFGGLHIGLTTRSIRTWLVARLGEGGFFSLFPLVAVASFTGLVRYYALHRFEGASGLALGAEPALRWPLMGIVVLGVVLINGALAAYPRSAMALFRRTVPEPYGLDRVSRHPFFVGVGLLAVAHVLLATRLTGTVFAAGLALVAFVGAWHQDRKLHGLRGAAYGRYLATTSTLPFAAIAMGHQHLVWSELPWTSLFSGLVLAAVLPTFHPPLSAPDGSAP